MPLRETAAIEIDPRLAALATLKASKNGMLAVIILALLTTLAAFCLVEFARYFEGPARNRIGEGTLGPPHVWVDALDHATHWLRIAMVLAASALPIILFTHLMVVLATRKAGVPAAARAFTGAIVLWVVALPWSSFPLELAGGGDYSTNLMGPIARFGRAEGTMSDSVYADGLAYTSGSLLARRQAMVDLRRDIADKSPGAPDTRGHYLREANYFGRFLVFPALTLLWVLIVQRRYARSFRETFPPPTAESATL